jgi:hypothetical protein
MQAFDTWLAGREVTGCGSRDWAPTFVAPSNQDSALPTAHQAKKERDNDSPLPTPELRILTLR